MDTPKQDLHRYLHVGRDALRWKLDGLTELDARRSLTPTGLNLLGLVHHVAVCAAGYFGEVLDRPFAEPLPDVAADPHADFVVPADVDLADALGFVAARGRMPTPRSRPSPWTPPVTCRGGPARGPT